MPLVPDEIITNGSVALTSPNPDLKWETSTQTDVGVDVELRYVVSCSHTIGSGHQCTYSKRCYCIEFGLGIFTHLSQF
ncbi:MAG: TonB-dependent receptor [Saprospiraceae bacterium]|nr:TonB-dependent receptor [Saprospiraceae bacterium]